LTLEWGFFMGWCYQNNWNTTRLFCVRAFISLAHMFGSIRVIACKR